MSYIPEQLLEEIESLKNSWKFKQAIDLVNEILFKDPTNEEALIQVADIQYRKWELDKAGKAIDFLNQNTYNEDETWLYMKWILEMEKNNRIEAKKYFRQVLKITNFENIEALRCYGLCEYRYGNRQKWIWLVEEAFELNKNDAEIVYNLIELYLLEFKYSKANKFISYYQKNKEKLESFEKPINYYDEKINLFDSFVKDYMSSK